VRRGCSGPICTTTSASLAAAGFIASILGAMVLLLAYRLIRKLRAA
jgi:uncharacterized membrane protein YeaQ/YmgE (transglycosylase-associated protein family)